MSELSGPGALIAASVLQLIKQGHDALDSFALDDPARADLYVDLAAHLWKLYKQTDSDDALDEIFDVSRALAALQHPGRSDLNRDRAFCCIILAHSLFTRYISTGDATLLAPAIHLQRETLSVHSVGHSYRAISCNKLATFLRFHHKETGDVSALEEATKLAREVLGLHPIGDPNRGSACGNLASFLGTSYNQTGSIAVLEEIIELQREAFGLLPVEHPAKASLCQSLSKSLIVRYNDSGDLSLLNDAIRLGRDATGLCPLGHPHRANACWSLATALTRLYDRTGDAIPLEEAIALEREAFSLRPVGHPNRAMSCGTLAYVLRSRYTQTSDLALLREAIDLQREAHNLRPVGHSERVESCGELTACLHSLYNHTGDVALLAEALELGRECLDLSSTGLPSLRAHAATSLAQLLKTRYHQTGDLALLKEAIDIQRKALSLHPVGHPSRANSCGSLASLLGPYYEQIGDVVLLKEAIELEREALRCHPVGHHARASSCGNLAAFLSLCYGQSEDLAILDEIIDLENEVLRLCPIGHPGRASSCDNLSNSLMTRYTRTGDISLLEAAIVLGREALGLRPAGHHDRGLSCNNLAQKLDIVYRQTWDSALLEEVVELGREALGLHADHPNRAMSCSNLANSLAKRYLQTRDAVLLEEANELHREALRLRPLGHPSRGLSCVNLARSLHVRYYRTGDVTLLKEAVELGREALSLCPIGHSDRASTCASLATSLRACYLQSGNSDVTLLDRAIELGREALSLCPLGHNDRAMVCGNLANSLIDHYVRTEDSVTLLEEAIGLEREASRCCNPNRAWRSHIALCKIYLLPATPLLSSEKAVECLRQCVEEQAVDDLQSLVELVSKNLRSLWTLQDTWSPIILSSLVRVYEDIVDRLPMMAGFVLDTAARLQTLQAAQSHLGSGACIAALLVGQPSRAIELLDHSQGIVWAQALHQRDPQLEGAPTKLAQELDKLLRDIAVPMPLHSAELESTQRQVTHLSPHDMRHTQNGRIQVILNEIRAVPGLERFMRGSTFEMLRKAAHKHAVVVLVEAHGHVFALLMSSSSQESPDVLRLGWTQDDTQLLADFVTQTNARYRTGSRDYAACESHQDVLLAEDLPGLERLMKPGNWHASRQSPLAQLWSAVVKPVLTHLRLTVCDKCTGGLAILMFAQKLEDASSRPRLHWCTSGDFASLPIHAAGIYTGQDQECCSDYVVSSYTPALTALVRARRDLQPVLTTEAKLLLVAAEHTAVMRLPALPKVKAEMSDISSIAHKAGVPYAAPSRVASTTEQMTAALPSATLVHVACHGLQDPKDPLKSAFHLSDDGVLSVSDLMKLDLKGAYLAFLSACETAKGDRDQPDQAIHLAATMLFVGFRSVVATMW
jgi:tetratricopeptide (TPR) repeat protein